jgi:hypothetical protein
MKWTELQLREAARTCKSVRSVAIRLGLTPYGSTYATLKKYFGVYEIDTSHFTGKIHRTSTPSNKKIPHDKLFIANSTTQRSTVRKRIVSHNLLPYYCAVCGIAEWRNTQLSLVLDHINGINNDHRLENLRWLCPNCNSLQDTFAGRNKK